MPDWTAGYVADIAYTYGYYGELNPARIAHAFLNAGLAPPTIATACELGFGQGLSTAMHAAASPVSWYGTDFNPTQASFAQELAAVSGSGARLFDQSFEEFCTRDDLPDFDFIALHGIWSWISDDNRKVIVDFVRRKLKVGGVLYISYNTEPGWVQMLPLRRMMTAHSRVMSPPGMSMTDKIERALEFAERLLETKPITARANPAMAERLKVLKTQPRNYLAHEYFNQDWDPMDFSDMAEWLAPAKLGFACSAHVLDHVHAINLTLDQKKMLDEIPDAVLRESMRDFMIGQAFRRDLWVRGARPMPRLESMEATGRLRVILCSPRADITLKVKASLGEATMQPAVYDTVLDILADYRPRTLAELEQQLAGKGVDVPAMLEAVLVLSGKGDLALAQDKKVIAEAKPRCDKLNAHLINKARAGGDIAFLASPVTGGAVGVNRFEQLFLLARTEGKKSTAEYAGFVAALLASQGTQLVKDGKAVDDPQESMAMLMDHATRFEARLPVLRALGVVS